MANTHRNSNALQILLLSGNFEALRDFDISEFAATTDAVTESATASTTLSQEAMNAIGSALSPRTWDSYVTAIEKYSDWCNYYGIPPFPASPVVLSNYLASLAASGKRSGTLTVASCAISYVHRLQELPSPTHSQLVRSTLRGIRRGDGRTQRQAEPLTPDILDAIRKSACTPRRTCYGRMETPEFARHRGNVDLALCSTLFYAGLRRSEAAELTWDDIKRQKDGSGLIYIYQSKRRLPDDVQVVAIPACAMADLNAIRASTSSDGKVFGLSPGQIDNRIKSALAQADVPGRFSSHSGRVGMALYLKYKNAPDHIIRQQGRWKDYRMLDRYTRRAKASIVLKYFD